LLLFRSIFNFERKFSEIIEINKSAVKEKIKAKNIITDRFHGFTVFLIASNK
jgi:hypothetical protein